MILKIKTNEIDFVLDDPQLKISTYLYTSDIHPAIERIKELIQKVADESIKIANTPTP